jgi:NAD(P)-dependent dehydrogenase (short-subunit alcohol dehydrogenase family)
VSAPLAGRSALVTGASQGIGAEIARVFAAAGASVVLTSRREGALEEVVRAIRADGGDARWITADLAHPVDVHALAERAGPIDVLVNNAAAHVAVAPPMPLLDTRDEHYDAVMAVNLRSPYLLARALGRGMAERGRGAIVNVSSVASTWTEPGLALYGASKAALEALTRSLAIELAPSGVRCNAIAPGLVTTPALEIADVPVEQVRSMIPIGRAGRASEIAAVALWLASDASSFVTGQVLIADGGMTLGPFGLGTL